MEENFTPQKRKDRKPFLQNRFCRPPGARRRSGAEEGQRQHAREPASRGLHRCGKTPKEARDDLPSMTRSRGYSQPRATRTSSQPGRPPATASPSVHARQVGPRVRPQRADVHPREHVRHVAVRLQRISNSPKSITLTHPFGRKWSLYLSSFFVSAFQDTAGKSWRKSATRPLG